MTDRPRGRYGPTWDDASLLPGRIGIPWWAAVVVALGLTATGVMADLQRINRLGLIFQACYFLGCLLAIVVVRRKELFGPMAQPPLILAFVVPGVVLLAGGAPSGGGIAGRMLAVATPLINGFPTMAITVLLTLAVGTYRLVTQRPPATARAGNARARSGRCPPPDRSAAGASAPAPRHDRG
ncbi:MAG: hypothetical protein GEV09_22830 [Pseudonocardiaceae bacterium]|nr:hypothetical protein [Pseudonocardiaceae bacterium]